MPPLSSKIALVAGATRGVGRGIAVALGEAGATVYCSGRSTRGALATPGRPETIDETAEMVTARGGKGIAVRVDHTVPNEVQQLVERIRREHGRLDILVNDVWGGDQLTEWGKKFWEVDLDKGFLMLQRAVHSHIITSRYAVPLMREQKKGLIVEVTDGDQAFYRGQLFYDLVKSTVIRLAMAMSFELRGTDITALAITPGFLRSEAMLEHFGVTEENWRDATKKDPFYAESETPFYVGRAVAALAADPRVGRKAGKVFSSWALSDEYGFSDVDGRRPHWGRFIKKHTDERWNRLVAQARKGLGPSLKADRKRMTLRAPLPTAGKKEWHSLELTMFELFFPAGSKAVKHFIAQHKRYAQRDKRTKRGYR
jgi:NAD(P)-dependent dehydrogenase (short-subunit alcohol dehydrogenase family)